LGKLLGTESRCGAPLQQSSNSGHAAFVVVVDKIDRRQDIHYDIYTRMNRMN